jgi:hypothetical protein
MTKQLSAVLAAAALTLSASAYAAVEQSVFPFSVNDAGPVLTAQQQAYQDQWAASHQRAEGVAGRPGLAMEGIEATKTGFYEVQTPSRGGPIDD